MTKDQAITNGLSLVERSGPAMLATFDAEGYPDIRALSKIAANGIKEVWFATHASTRHVSNLRNDARAYAYFVDPPKYRGLSLVGSAEILLDADTRRKLWRPAFEGFFKSGVYDPDYCVLHFTARKAPEVGSAGRRLRGVTETIPPRV